MSAMVDLILSVNRFASLSNVDVSKSSTAVEAAAVVGFDGLSVGGQAKYDVTAQQLSDFNAAAEYSHNDYTASLKTADQAGKLNTSFFHKYNADIQYGGVFAYDLDTARRLFTIGGSYKLDGNATAKAKLDTNGVFSALLEQKLVNPAVKFIFSSEFNAKQASTVPEKFGLAVCFGDE